MSTLKLAKLGDAPEIFHTLQGEGVSMGVPSVFVRASLCNLHCEWCDTDYTWNWQGTPWKHENDSVEGYKKYRKEDYLLELDVAEIAAQISSYPCTNVILTGGEPLLQQSGWLALIETLRASDPSYTFEVETNGTQLPNTEMQAAITQWNVSPKLSNSGNAEKLRINSKALAFFASAENAWFKFVVQSEQDLTEVQQLEKEHSIPRHKILLMPEGRDLETLQKRRLWLADICRDQGYRFSDRLHIHLWGSKRGV